MRMRLRFVRCLLIAVVFPLAGQAGNGADVHIRGYVADRMNACYRNHVAATDPMYYAREFRYPAEAGAWQTEFWGKYMHAAAPFARYTGSERLGAKIAASTLAIIGSQEPGGYIGNYAPANRYSRGWDVWGTKYTLMGLMHYYDYAVRDPSLKPSAAKALEAAKRLCDYLIAERGPKGRTELRFTDYASAGNVWRPDNRYRVWLPALIRGREY